MLLSVNFPWIHFTSPSLIHYFLLKNLLFFQGDQVLVVGSKDSFDFSTNKKTTEEEDSNFVVGFVGEIFSIKNHFKENKTQFILFISLTVVVGLSVFLAAFLWNLYRSKRLDRIAKRLRQPNLSQSTLCSAASNNDRGRRTSENAIGKIKTFRARICLPSVMHR